MTTLRVWLARLVAMFRRRRLERELDEELQFHLEHETEKNVAAGMSAEEARRAARRSFGGVDQTVEKYRDARGMPWIETICQDLRYGLRTLRANPGFTLVAVLSLALGIGANCAVFTIVNAALLRDLPVKDPDRLVRLSVYGQNARPLDLSYPAFRAIEARQTTLEGLAASGSLRLNHVVFEGEELQELQDIRGIFVSANYFSLLGLRPAAGRFFSPADSSRPAEGEVAVISYGLWVRRFASDPSIIGKTINLNSVRVTIAGVAPAEFRGERQGPLSDIYVPLLMQPRFMPRNMLEMRTATWFRAFGRLRPGVTQAQAEAELTAIYRQDTRDNGAFRGSINDLRVATTSIRNGLGEQERAALWGPLGLLMAVVVLVLLVSCCNVANLLLARASSRQREIGIRLAVGSSRRRLIGQLLTESALLAGIGGSLGFAAAWLGTRGLQGSISGILPASLQLYPDARVLWFTAAISLAAGIVFGIVPAIQVSAGGLEPALRAGSRTHTSGVSRQRGTRLLVVTQVGLSLWLLVGAGLAVQSLRNYHELDMGIDRRNLVTFFIAPEPTGNPAEIRVRDLPRRIADRLQSVPGVVSVSFSVWGLFSPGGTTAPVRVPGSSVDPANDPDLRKSWVSPNFFQAMGMNLVSGRTMREGDGRVAVVNEIVARHYFGDENPLGRMIYFPKIDSQNRYVPFGSTFDPEQGVEIVGVVRDTKQDIKGRVERLVYMPLEHTPEFPNALYVRTAADPEKVAAQVRRALKEFSRNVLVDSMWQMGDWVDGGLGQERLLARLLSFFGALALILASVGLFGVMSYSVVRRTGEIGIRMALGARRGQVIGGVLRETLVLAVAGIALGIPAALASARLIRGFLFGLTPTDPATIAGVAAVLVIVALLAGFVPARRAARVDPLVALRHE